MNGDQLRDAISAGGGLVLLGCGQMGSAMLAGWLRGGIRPGDVWVLEPRPSDWLTASAVHLNEGVPASPAIVLVAVKPQMMGTALPQLQALGNGRTLFVTVAAGTTLATYETVLGDRTPVVRAMPNTPAAIGKGITAICGNANVTAAHLDLAAALLSAVGKVERLAGEHQMDAVTAVSGSGPAYVFHLIETLAAAGVAEGLPAGLAMRLAKATVAGAGALAESSDQGPDRLRVNVTSPGGTTAAALAVLMDETDGLAAMMRRAVHAAAERGRELGK